ncbi:MAG: glycosyltransferase family 39 protein, partial [Deltaproteobacteria bacterium]|nr:glycosyltransferase family 39 protein [Deltaproteobacteria bacterium]
MSNRVNLETSPLGQSSKSAPRHAVVLLLLVLLEVLVRVLAVYHFGEGQWSIASFSDEKNYYLPAARAILEQGSAFFLTPRSLWNGPVNPLWIALWQADIASVKIANIVLISLCSLCVWDIARVLFGYAAAYTALALFILYPPFLEFAPTVLTEPPFIFLLALSFWFYVCCPWRMTQAAICAGVALGLAILTRPTAQLFPLFLLCILGVVWLVSWCTGKSLQFGQRKLVTFAVAAALTITPYIAKNYFCFGKLGIANGLGAVLFLGNDLRTSGDEPLYSQMSF